MEMIDEAVRQLAESPCVTFYSLTHSSITLIKLNYLLTKNNDRPLPARRMVMETIDKVVRQLGTADIDARLEELLIDGILYAYQEQVGRFSPCVFALFCLLWGEV